MKQRQFNGLFREKGEDQEFEAPDRPVIDQQVGVHPFAAQFPMMSENDLADLAADLKVNGQRYKIIRDKDDQILDGRNRLRACEIAGIEPQFERYDGDDPISFIWSSNGARRHLTKGQLAMVAAKAYPDPERRGRGQKSSAAEEFPMVSSGKLSEARTVLRYAPDLAENVVDGLQSLEAAYDTACKRKGETAEAEYRMQRLRQKAPDLANLVSEQKITLEAARERWAEWGYDGHGKTDDLGTILEILARKLHRCSPKKAAEKLVASFSDPDSEFTQEEEFSRYLARGSEVLLLCAALFMEREREKRPPPLGRRELGSTLNARAKDWEEAEGYEEDPEGPDNAEPEVGQDNANQDGEEEAEEGAGRPPNAKKKKRTKSTSRSLLEE